MNTVSTVLLGAVVIAFFAVLWVVLTQKNKGSGCSGNCSGCSGDCSGCAEARKKKEDKG